MEIQQVVRRTPASSDNSFTPKLPYIRNSKIAVKCEGNSLKQEKISFIIEMQYVSIIYELDKWSHNINTDFTLNDCFGSLAE